MLRPYLSRYMVEYTATGYPAVMGIPVYYNPYIDTGATNAAAAVYMVDTSAFEIHMTPPKARAYWENSNDCYVWKWKARMVPVAIPMHDGTYYVKGICGYDIDLIT